MANVLASNTLAVLPLLSGAVEEGLLRWLRAAELTCDRAALLVAQDHRVVISALMKLAGGSPKLNAELNVEAFLRQVSCAVTCYAVLFCAVLCCNVVLPQKVMPCCGVNAVWRGCVLNANLHACMCFASLCCALIRHATLHIGHSCCQYPDERRLQTCCCRHALTMKPVQRPLAGTSRTHRPERSLIHFLSCALGKLTTGLQAVSIVLCWQRTIRIAGECHRRSDLGWDRSKMPCINWNKKYKMHTMYNTCSGHQCYCY